VRETENFSGMSFAAAPQWKVYPTVAMFRDATGEPGWVAATTRGRTIQTQPAEVLRQAGTLESTLRHELLHMLIEAHAKPGTPVWYREGLVLYLSEPDAHLQSAARFATVAELEKAMNSPGSEEQLRNAYADAHARVSRLAKQYGKQKLITWVQEGLPAQVAESR
jgi:stage II sporulation protein D